MTGPVWQFRFSPTLKGIYVLRYLLFSGGAAVLGAVVERVLFHSTGMGLLVGLVIGLTLFRGQLRPFSLPTLALGRDHLFFVRRQTAHTLAWSRIESVQPEGHAIAVTLRDAEGRKTRTLMRALDFGLTNDQLVRLLSGYRETAARESLPTDDEVRVSFKVREDARG